MSRRGVTAYESWNIFFITLSNASLNFLASFTTSDSILPLQTRLNMFGTAVVLLADPPLKCPLLFSRIILIFSNHNLPLVFRA